MESRFPPRTPQEISGPYFMYNKEIWAHLEEILSTHMLSNRGR